MNKTDVIAKIEEKTGLSVEICEAVVNAFEEQSGDVLANKFKGLKSGSTDVLAGVSAKSGKTEEECEKVLAALDEVLDAGLADKLLFWKRKK